MEEEARDERRGVDRRGQQGPRARMLQSKLSPYVHGEKASTGDDVHGKALSEVRRAEADFERFQLVARGVMFAAVVAISGRQERGRQRGHRRRSVSRHGRRIAGHNLRCRQISQEEIWTRASTSFLARWGCRLAPRASKIIVAHGPLARPRTAQKTLAGCRLPRKAPLARF